MLKAHRDISPGYFCLVYFWSVHDSDFFRHNENIPVLHYRLYADVIIDEPTEEQRGCFSEHKKKKTLHLSFGFCFFFFFLILFLLSDFFFICIII